MLEDCDSINGIWLMVMNYPEFVSKEPSLPVSLDNGMMFKIGTADFLVKIK